jgi:hypothetical protein
MSEVLSEESMLANTSHECNTVSPINHHLSHQPANTSTRTLTFKKMIQTSIPRNLKFRPNAHGSSTSLGNDDTLDNAFHISLFALPYAHPPHFQLRFRVGVGAAGEENADEDALTWKSIAH